MAISKTVSKIIEITSETKETTRFEVDVQNGVIRFYRRIKELDADQIPITDTVRQYEFNFSECMSTNHTVIINGVESEINGLMVYQWIRKEFDTRDPLE